MHREERTMTTIYLIRHAEAEGNVFRRIHGQYDSCVTPNGRRQIAALAQRFAGIPVDAVYASDLKRTCLTATAVYRQKGLPLHRDARFREVGLGPWEDTPFGELERRYPAQLHAFSHDSYHWYVEGAECFLQYAHRFLAGLNDASHLTPELSTLGRQNWWRGSRYLDFNMWYRDVAPEDAPLLAALGCPQTEPGDRVRIAMLRDTPAGMVATRRLDGDEGALLHLALLPEHRGCGLAAQLLGEAICPLRAGGVKHLRLLRPVTDKGTKRLLATYGITDGCSIVPTEE